MAVSVIPKSEFRRDDNIVEGYGEVPAAYAQNADGDVVQGWALPDGRITFREEEARLMAKKLDEQIRASMKSPDDLIRYKR